MYVSLSSIIAVHMLVFRNLLPLVSVIQNLQSNRTFKIYRINITKKPTRLYYNVCSEFKSCHSALGILSSLKCLNVFFMQSSS